MDRATKECLVIILSWARNALVGGNACVNSAAS